MTTPVSFDLAKLLKEKEFGLTEEDYIQLPRWFDDKGEYFENIVCLGKKLSNSPNYLGADTINDFEADLVFMDNSLLEVYLAPTIAEVVMWLYENHGIWIYTRPFSSGYFHGYIVDNIGEMKEAINSVNFNSPTEAYEAAIEYCLTKLI